MDVQTLFVVLAFLLIPVFCFREAWKGWRSGAVDKIKKNAREPVFAYRNQEPLQFWSYVLVYAGCGCLSFGVARQSKRDTLTTKNGSRLI
ncbi:TPA: DUF2542 family protein [Citrobacter freundii]|nr:DUF2542 family protein [Citrobacter freundii]